MCGIVGFVGRKEAEPILVEGLRRLEYRGYDSAGIATLTGPHLHLRKRAGRIADLATHLRARPAPGCRGIGHTPWATHVPAHDPAALVGFTDKVVYLHDHQMCALTPEDWHILDMERTRVAARVQQINWEPGDADKGAYEHHMLKEIYEQPEALENAMRGRLDDADSTSHFGGLNLDARALRRAERLIITGCGTSYHAGLIGEYLIEEFARIPV